MSWFDIFNCVASPVGTNVLVLLDGVTAVYRTFTALPQVVHDVTAGKAVAKFSFPVHG